MIKTRQVLASSLQIEKYNWTDFQKTSRTQFIRVSIKIPTQKQYAFPYSAKDTIREEVIPKP